MITPHYKPFVVKCSIVAFVFTVLLISSCCSLKKNYLGTSRRGPDVSQVNLDQLTKLDSSRRQLDVGVDSLLKIIMQKKSNGKHLSAREVNLLYTDFGNQLNYDRITHILINMGKTRRKDLSEQQRYAGARLLTAAASYERTYQRSKFVRRIINRGDDGNNIPRRILQKSQRFLYSPAIRRKLSNSSGNPTSTTDSLLHQLPSTNFLKSAFFNLYHRNDRIHAFLYRIFPFVGKSVYGIAGSSSPNRKKQRQDAMQLLPVLQPYDILLSKSPGNLSASVIPGYFEHAAIWLGEEVPRKGKKIREALVKDFGAGFRIREKEMIEALRSGVQLSNLINYADGETYLILRRSSLAADQKKSIINLAMKQLHKRYDYNFDIESSDMVNCTELVYLVYDFIHWRGRTVMGRYTLLPDDILLTALEEPSFEIVALITNGEVTMHPDTSIVRALLK